jgi:hypothetical protein
LSSYFPVNTLSTHIFLAREKSLRSALHEHRTSSLTDRTSVTSDCYVPSIGVRFSHARNLQQAGATYRESPAHFRRFSHARNLKPIHHPQLIDIDQPGKSAFFALPPTFPPELVPEACAQFVRDCVPGLTTRELLALTQAHGWRPTWKPLQHLTRDDLEAFGLGLTVDGCGVPLIARMRRVGQGVRPTPPQERNSRQMNLF